MFFIKRGHTSSEHFPQGLQPTAYRTRYEGREGRLDTAPFLGSVNGLHPNQVQIVQPIRSATQLVPTQDIRALLGVP